MLQKPVLSDPNFIVKVSPRGATRLKSGHVWVYRSDIVSAEDVPPGSLVLVTDHRGQTLGSALYSSSSQIAIRLISREPVADLPALLRQRVAQAVAYREPLIRDPNHDTNAYRVIFSEADFLPGLIVDRYNDVLSLQILTQAMDAEAVRGTLISELTGKLHPASIVERVDARARQLEELPPRSSGLLQGEKSSTMFAMNGVRFHFDALEGQKNGSLPRSARELCRRRTIWPWGSARRFLLSGRICSPSRQAMLSCGGRRQLPSRPGSGRPERRAQRTRD